MELGPYWVWPVSGKDTLSKDGPLLFSQMVLLCKSNKISNSNFNFDFVQFVVLKVLA